MSYQISTFIVTNAHARNWVYQGNSHAFVRDEQDHYIVSTYT